MRTVSTTSALPFHSGSIQIALPSDTSARFDVRTLSGEIDNEFGVQPRCRHVGGVGRRLDFQAGEGDALVTIKTFSGGVEIEGRNRD